VPEGLTQPGTILFFTHEEFAMMKFTPLAIAAVIALASGAAIRAQEVAKPGPEHEMLKKMEGNWTTVMKAAGKEFKGNVEYKMGLGGLWLCGKLESECPLGSFTGMSHDTYDAKKGKYVSIWIDSQSTTPMMMEGTCDKEKKTITLMGEGPGMDGKMTKAKGVWHMLDDNHMMYSMYMGDSKEPMFTVDYMRK